MTFRGAALSFLVTSVVAVATVAAIADSPQYGEATNGVGGGRYNYDYSQQQQQQQQPQSTYGEPLPRSQGGYSYQQGQPQQQQGHYGYDPSGQQEQGLRQVQENEQKIGGNEKEDGYQNSITEEEQLPPLPEGWSEFIDPASGRKYYYHAEKRITTWNRPLPPPVVPVKDESAAENSSINTNTGGAESAGPEVKEQEQEQRTVNDMGEVDVAVEDHGTTGQQQQQVEEQSNSELNVASTPKGIVDSSLNAVSTDTDISAAAGSGSVRDTNTSFEEERRQPFGVNDLKPSQQGWGLQKEHAESGYYSNESQPNNVIGMENQQWKPSTSSSEQLTEGQPNGNTSVEGKENQQPPAQNINSQQEQDRIGQKKPPGYFGDRQHPPQQQDPRRQVPQPQYQSSDLYRNPPQQRQPPIYGNPPHQGDPHKQYAPTFVPGQQQQPPNKYPFVPPQQDKPVPEAAPPPGKLRQLWGKVSSSDADVKSIAQKAGVNQGVSPGMGGDTGRGPPSANAGNIHNAGTGFDRNGLQSLPDRNKGGPDPIRSNSGILPPQHNPLQHPTVPSNPQAGRQYNPPSWPQHQQPPPQNYRNQYNGMYGQQQYQQEVSGPGYGLHGGPINTDKPSTEPTSALKDAWNGVLGFGNRTKAAVEQAADTVVQGASTVSENVSNTGLGVWGKLKNSFFESNTDQRAPDNYSISPYGQPPMPGHPPQQRPQYPPQNYGGYPGPTNPGPREIQPYPHQQRPGVPGTRPQGPPLQSQWGDQQRWQGNAGAGPGPAPGSGPGPQGQFRGNAPGQGGQPGPESGVRRPPPQQQQQPPQQQQQPPQGQPGWNGY